MTTIAQGSELLKRLISEGKIKPALPTPPTSFPTPSVEPGLNPLLRGPVPAGSWNASDMTRQFHQSAVPQTRVLPISSIANPVVGAQAASQAILIQSTTTSSTSTSSSGTDDDIISDKNRQTFGSFDSSSSKTDNSGSVSSISTTTLAATANELAVVIAVARANATVFPGLTPGVGWARSCCRRSVAESHTYGRFAYCGPRVQRYGFGRRPSSRCFQNKRRNAGIYWTRHRQRRKHTNFSDVDSYGWKLNYVFEYHRRNRHYPFCSNHLGHTGKRVCFNSKPVRFCRSRRGNFQVGAVRNVLRSKRKGCVYNCNYQDKQRQQGFWRLGGL
jgi:hypothetical protein